jgi:hypothetical protein
LHALTARELEVANLVCVGLSFAVWNGSGPGRAQLLPLALPQGKRLFVIAITVFV